MVDTVRGALRVRKWPKKYGKPRSALQAWWIDWFRQANLLAKYVDGMTAARAITLTKGTGLYPRDIILKAMRGRLYYWTDENGKKWFPMAAVQNITDTLDVLAQTVGSVLVRAVDRWRAPDPGNLNDVLTLQGTPPVPAWSPGAGGGAGVVQEALSESPINPDNTQNSYEFAVEGYFTVDIMLDNIGFAGSTTPDFLFSIDGGLTYETGGAAYRNLALSASAEASADNAWINFRDLNATTNHHGTITFTSLNAGRASWQGFGSRSTSVKAHAGFANFDGPITNIKIKSTSGANFNAGVIRAVGLR